MGGRSALDHARLLLQRARGDQAALQAMIANEDVPDEILGFHAQQAVEKSLKAVLAVREIDYELTHNIAYLVERLRQDGVEAPEGVAQGEQLTPWAVGFRYEGGSDGSTLDRTDAATTARSSIEWATSLVER